MSTKRPYKTIVLSLPDAKERRSHIAAHFARVGITNYRFVDAFGPKSPIVMEMYQLGRVFEFPPCFRCGQVSCDCQNNILIPQQVANFCSFIKMWRDLLCENSDQMFLICEDDVSFHDGALEALDEFLTTFEPSGKPLLIRLAESGVVPDQKIGAPLRISHVPCMSNAAYIINAAMAGHLVANFHSVTTTSDIWLHSERARDPEVEAFTLQPLLATELSYNRDFARFPSEIHPKGIDEMDIERQTRHVKRVSSEDEYSRLRRIWISETPDFKIG